MESRKAWRNRERSAGESVLALLEGLRNGLGAEGVGLFDDDRAERHPPTLAGGSSGALNFWDAFDHRPCAAIDWDGWYEELKKTESVDTTCGCGGGHRLCGFLIHGRWALLLVVPPVLSSEGPAAIASSLRALAAKLPPAKSREEWEAIERYDGEPATSRGPVRAPVWWVRKPPQ